MDFADFFADKSIKAKAQTEALSAWILAHPKQINLLLEFAATSKDPIKATCIEAMEFATRKDASVATLACLQFVSKTLTEKAPRVKWESAKVIANTAHLFPTKLDEAIGNLLTNTEHSGTVVRWSAALALGEILKLKTKHNKELLPVLENCSAQEEKNSIKKIYQAALKKVKG